MWRCLPLLPIVLAAPRLPIFSTTVDPTIPFHEATEKFKAAMNLSVDPCEDFFQFSCGNWIANHPIPSYMMSYTNFNEVRERVKYRMKELYETKNVSASRAIEMVRRVYHSCMDVDTIEKIGAKEVLDDFASLGYFPVVHGDKWQREKFDLTDLLIGAAHSRGLKMTALFVDVDCDLDIKNVTRRILNFDQGILALGEGTRNYYLDKVKYAKQLNAYKTLYTKIAVHLTEDAGYPVNEDKIALDVDRVVEFETRFAEIQVSEDERRDLASLYHLKRLSDFQSLMPVVDWKKYFLSTTPAVIHDYILSNPEVVIFGWEFFEQLTSLLKSTDPEVITNYVLFRYLNQLNLEMAGKYQKLEEDFARDMYGRKKRAPRWKDCVNAANAKMDYASGSMYVRKHFDKESKTMALNMISDLQREFYEMLDENDWMDEETKEYARLKARQMNKLIGYPDFLLNDKQLDNFYKQLDILPSDNYKQIVSKLFKFTSDYRYRRLLEVVDRDEFTSNAATVNAYYSAIRNAIILPAGILQAPFFHKNYPKALNYGSIGSILGHEITHGFDDRGRQFDALGSLRGWWEGTTSKNFIKRAQCLIEQYGNVTVNININGKLTLGENIADIGGVKEGFRAYKRYLSKHGEEKRIPGFEQFDNHQMFFIGYAQNWCGTMTSQFEVRILLSDYHPPGQYRAADIVSYLTDFQRKPLQDVGDDITEADISFLHSYLHKLYEDHKSEEIQKLKLTGEIEADTEQLLREAKMFWPLSNFFWGLEHLVDYVGGNDQLDHEQLYMNRLAAYFALKSF